MAGTGPRQATQTCYQGDSEEYGEFSQFGRAKSCAALIPAERIPRQAGFRLKRLSIWHIRQPGRRWRDPELGAQPHSCVPAVDT
jgi:hypothetical protein